ncbi:MAG: signal peptidase I, partial [Planctomycetales bacterium]|nr:signal peptidase I [Planctomycetales bacterium]NIM09876.1 signal peptidase I [Planctomycetales bacterium]NIN09314.1 signal peptidase I [Planctomycetales bacterium]NIN78422.1 signal peptidase I [Planctomycetales bacterium]NIO35598.1 signal peptidase I [Planctomycetales bacterium]
GDRLLIDKLTLALRPPRRWEVVVFRCPRRASQYCIKRIVGLPGETVQIVKGEVLVNGRRVRKSLSQFRKMAILVHDTRFRHGAQRQRPWPWQATGETGWRSTGAGFRYVPDASRQTPEKTRQVEWLEFQYRSGSPAKPPDAGPILVSDDYGYNQSLSRPLQEVNDLLLVCRVKVSGAGELYLRAATADRLFEARLQPAAGSGQLYADGNLVDQLVDREPFLGGPQLLEWTTIDGTCRLVVDGRLLLGYTPAERAGDARRRGTTAVATGKTAEPVAVSSLWPLGIGAVNVEVETANLQVYRDVYYTKLRTAAGRDRVKA